MFNAEILQIFLVLIRLVIFSADFGIILPCNGEVNECQSFKPSGLNRVRPNRQSNMFLRLLLEYIMKKLVYKLTEHYATS